MIKSIRETVGKKKQTTAYARGISHVIGGRKILKLLWVNGAIQNQKLSEIIKTTDFQGYVEN